MDKYYDMIALDFDQSVQDDVKNDNFPYGGYRELQDIIINEIFDNKHISKAKILDIGIGTATLYEKISPSRIQLTGIDISKKMLEVARLKFPKATLINHDILKGMPEELHNKQYDYIVLNYVLRHFELDTMISLIHQLVDYLAPFGKIFIGDLMFICPTNKQQFLTNNPQVSSYAYHFHTFEEITKKVGDILALSFMEINNYTGILIIEKYRESPLHFEESLLKYKSNTEKWKSSQSRKKRE